MAYNRKRASKRANMTLEERTIYLEKRKADYAKNPEKYKEIAKKRREENSEKIKIQRARRYTKNPEKYKIQKAKSYIKNREKHKIKNATDYAKNPEKYRIKNAAYLKTSNGKIASKKHTHKRNRELDFQPLNIYFENSDAHHLDPKNVIFIPKKLHESNRHRQNNNESMKTINIKAWDFMESQVY